MAVPPESVGVGKCYLAARRETPQVWRVITIFPDGRLEYEARPLSPKARQVWRSAMTTLKLFSAFVTREVPCDWTPEMDE